MPEIMGMKSPLKEFGVTQVLKFVGEDGKPDIVYPIYDMGVLRAGLVYTDALPEEVPGHIKQNCERIPGRLEFSDKLIDEPCAVVGYGPTLKKFGSKLRDFKHIITTSGAHNFLLDRDITPNYHVEVDFRERKAVHTKTPHPDIEYYMASMVHPATIDNVKDHRVKLWHINLKGIEYPKGEFVLEGYWDVGQEAILVAKALGYRDLHLFGYDYAYELGTGNTHAGFHNGMTNKHVYAKVGEKLFHTSDNLARGVMVFTALMEDNPDLNLTVYSDGLLSSYIQQHFAIKD